MKRIKSITALILALCLLLTSCASSNNENNSTDYGVSLGENIIFFNEPAEEYVVKCLENVATINGIAEVTEENDPNGKLNKDGGYISAVYFSSSLVQQDTLSKNELIEKGTSAGGCIEVFKTVEDANARNEYLSEFDGGLLDSGSHIVVGTVIIRISSSLDETQQKKLEEDIINAFITVEDEIDEENSTVADETVSETEESTTEESTTEESTTESTTKKSETTTKKQETSTKKQETTTKKTNTSSKITTTTYSSDIKYILNTDSMKFHYSSCHHAKKITDEHRAESNKSREALINMGYVPCKVCEP